MWQESLRARAAAGYARNRPRRTHHARSCLVTWPQRDRARARWRRSRRSGRRWIETGLWSSGSPILVNDAAIDDRHRDRQVEQVISVRVDRIGGEPGEIRAVTWLDASGYVFFRDGCRRSGRVAL